VRYLEGLTADQAGDRERALREWDRALFLDPAFVPARIRIGDLLAREGRSRRALLHFRNALESLRAGGDAVVSMPEGALPRDHLVSLCDQAVRALEEVA
jgi:tetratricopeptide (TPR) repeat protein